MIGAAQIFESKKRVAVKVCDETRVRIPASPLLMEVFELLEHSSVKYDGELEMPFFVFVKHFANEIHEPIIIQIINE